MNWVRPIICIALCMGLGFASGFSTVDAIDGWYKTIKKPVFNPPNWIFAPVWSALYFMMGLAAGLVWNKGLKKAGVGMALGLFVGQFVMNLAWTPVFFGRQQMGMGLVIIAMLLIGILLTMRRFFQLDRLSGWLMVPYLLWVSFATLLNASLWYLNK